MPTATPAPEHPQSSPGSLPADWPVAGLIRGGARPVSAQSVAVFRIGFGLLVAFSSVRFLAKGWVETLYLEPEHHLTYPYFGWVEPLPAPWMYLWVAAVACSGVAIAVGYRLRPALGMFLVGFAYLELIDAALYLNHYWFLTVVAALLLILPVGNHWSLDAYTGRVRPSNTVPAFVVWALRAQLAAVYLFAGLAKLNADWLFRAQPLRTWLADRTDVALVGPLLDEPVVAYLASWSGAAFDCTIVAWLLWRRTRPLAYLTLVGFHLVTGALFQIGVFPLVMIVATMIFFEPDWPSRLRRTGRSAPQEVEEPGQTATIRRSSMAALAVLAMLQVMMPLRHYAYPGDVRWTEEGYLGAWRVMLTEKAGHVEFEVSDPTTGEVWQASPTLVLTDWQAAVAATKPDLIHRTAQLLADYYAEQGRGPVEIRARALVTMNGRPAQLMIDPSVDLAAEPRSLAPAGWIVD